MNGNQIRVLSWIVDRYDARERPVTPADAADHFGSDVETVQACLDDLEENYLLTPVEEGGYRPTITARELLELDVRGDELLILDTDPDEK